MGEILILEYCFIAYKTVSNAMVVFWWLVKLFLL